MMIIYAIGVGFDCRGGRGQGMRGGIHRLSSKFFFFSYILEGRDRESGGAHQASKATWYVYICCVYNDGAAPSYRRFPPLPSVPKPCSSLEPTAPHRPPPSPHQHELCTSRPPLAFTPRYRPEQWLVSFVLSTICEQREGPISTSSTM